MSVRLTASLAMVLVLGAAAASAQPMSEQQKDRATAAQDVGALRDNSAELADLDAQIHRLTIRIHREHGDKQRADVAQSHELQARAEQIRAQSRHLGRDEHAVMHDLQQDRAAPH